MATAKQSPNLDHFGEEAVKLYKKITDSSKNYNERRKEQTEELRVALKPVWSALADGKEVNGCKDKLSWCKWANPSAKHPERYFYKVMSEKLKSVQSKKKQKIVLHDGMILSAHGMPSNLVQKEYEVVNPKKHGVVLKPVEESQNNWMIQIRVRPVCAEGEKPLLRAFKRNSA